MMRLHPRLDPTSLVCGAVLTGLVVLGAWLGPKLLHRPSAAHRDFEELRVLVLRDHWYERRDEIEARLEAAVKATERAESRKPIRALMLCAEFEFFPGSLDTAMRARDLKRVEALRHDLLEKLDESLKVWP